MKISKDIKPVTYLKNHAAEVIHQVNETPRPMIITQNGLPKAVIQDADSYQKMRDALMMLKIITTGETDIKEGHFKDQKQVFAEFDKKLEKLRNIK